MTILLILVFLIWLAVAAVRKEFASSGTWFNLFIAVAILIYLGVSVPKLH